MIRIIPLLFLLLLLSSSAEATNWCDDANNQVCYLLEEGSGTATDDASINDNDATLSTADLWSNASPPDTYSTWYTDFSNDSFTSDASVGVAHLLSSKTYVMWMMVNNETLGGIATQIGATKNNNETIITLNTNTLLFGHSGSTGIDVRPVNNSYSDDTWFHLGIYWDGGTEADNCHILIDGVEVSYGTRQDGVSLDSTSGYDTVFGYAESPNAYFDGQLDEIAMFDTELDSTDINMIMDTGLGHEFGVTDWCDDANAVGCWTVETGSGGTVVDQTSLSNNLTINGTVTWETASPPDTYSTYYLDFAGTDDYLERADDSDFDFSADLTLLSWGKPDNTDNADRLIYRYDSTSKDGYYLGKTGTDSGYWEWVIFVNPNAVICRSAVAPSGNWQHVVGVRDTNVLTLYVDGVGQVDTETLAGAIDSDSTLRMGIDAYGTSDYPGLMDEFAMFDKALDSTDINDIMDNGLAQVAATGRTRRFF